jgi:hypothetical protein
MKPPWYTPPKPAPAFVSALAGLVAVVNLACAQTCYGQAAPSLAWQAVAASADGNLLLAAPNGALIYTSTNAGAAWNPTSAPTNLCQSIAISADGTRLVALATPSTG